MKGITNYKPRGFEAKAFQRTDKKAREATARIKKFAKGRRCK